MPRSATTTKRSSGPAFLFDVDGTLVDTVYQHVVAWVDALARGGMSMPAWRVHRYIGMSGGMFVRAFAREIGRDLSDAEAKQMENWHKEGFKKLSAELHPLPGAKELLQHLTKIRVPWALATSGRRDSAAPALRVLGVSVDDRNVITREDAASAKPDPDLFLAAAKRIRMPPQRTVVIGDSIWDLLAARRANALGIGLLTGGYSRDELERAGAYRVYDDPADLLQHLEQVGVTQ
jgi:HAD superfamily hydrolase (TIGR01509 family)